ncbi:MAG: HAD family phosphatase [Phycisphaerae bacterium]|nr:HAD family phosphatase [Phycisphaerae bacterium]
MLRAVIFDFDGVITDSEVLHLQAFNNVLARYNIEIKEDVYYKEYLGFTDLDCFKSVIDKNKIGLDSEQIKNLIRQKNRVFEELAATEATIFEGVPEFLQLLSDNGVPMAICSGAVLEEIALILEQSGLGHFFAEIVAGDQVTKGKPDPEGFLLALERLNKGVQNPIAANECVVIEDSHWGLEAGNAAGMHTVGITNTYNPGQLSMAEKIVANLSELSIDDLQQLCA